MTLVSTLVCRVCQTTDNLELIFKKENVEILSMLDSVLSSKVTYNEAHPTCMCIQCISTLEEIYEFKSLYQKTYSKFKNASVCNERWQDPETNPKKLEIENPQKSERISPAFLADSTVNDKSETIKDSSKFEKKYSVSEVNDDNREEKRIGEFVGENSQDENSVDEFSISNEPETFHIRVNMQQTVGPNLRLHKCDKCERSFATSYSLKKHIFLHSNPDLYKCEECGKAFSTSKNLNMHKSRHIGHQTSNAKRHKCDKCDKSYIEIGRYRSHIALHSNPDLYKCNDCGTRCRNPSQLKEHNRKLCRAKGPFKCTHCEKIYATLDGLETHRVLHFAPDIHKCHECGISMKSLPILVRHKATVHSNRKLKCEICGKVYKGAYLFRAHVALHKNPNLYKCTECIKSFCSGQLLKAHQICHANPDKYKCETCGKSFTAKGHLKSHQTLHANTIKYEKCEICGKLYADARRLKNHLLLHSNPNLYRCEKCEKPFASSYTLGKHLKLHNNPK